MMTVPKKYMYCVIMLICGMYTHQQEAGNSGLGGEQKDDDDKRVSIVKREPKINECYLCKVDTQANANPLWSSCCKARWYHDQCKFGRPFKSLCGSSLHYCRRNKSGLIPLSMAIFRGKEDAERENSRAIVATITEGVGKRVLDMVMLRDHAKCSAWMHAIYCGDPVVIKTILLAVEQQTDDSDAVWKLLTSKDSGGYGCRASTPLMVAVRKKNIPVIKLLKDAAGLRIDEYLDLKSSWGETALNLAGDDLEILQLFLKEETH
jgi:hypothetical protein